MQRPGEQQHAEHAVQQGIGEIQAVHHPGDPRLQRLLERDRQQQRQGEQQGDQHRSDRRRQLEEAVIQPREHRRQGDQHGEDVVEPHRGYGFCMHWTDSCRRRGLGKR